MSSGKSNKVGALYDPTLDNCPHCKSELCIVAKNKGRDFPCTGGHFKSCDIFIRLKNGGVV